MNPIPHRRLLNMISTVQKYLKSLDLFSEYTWETIENDAILRGAYERYVFLLVQSTLDLVEAIISFKKLRKPSSYAEGLEILLENGIISHELRESLREIAKLRNAMSHDYEALNYKRLEEMRTSGHVVIRSLIAMAEKL